MIIFKHTPDALADATELGSERVKDEVRKEGMKTHYLRMGNILTGELITKERISC